MQHRKYARKKSRVEIIPMIDVMLFLLVFFIMATMHMITDAGLKLNLPTSSQAKELPHPHYVLNIQTDGTIKVKDKILTIPEVTQLLASDGDPSKTDVTIASDKKVEFQHFVQVMDACQKAGVSNIGIAADTPN